MNQINLTKRQVQLLKIIIEMYINKAKPIASKTTLLYMEKTGFSCSSATIRNEMAVLEQMNYIEKAYNSGGRIPTNKGYNYYTDNLLKCTLDNNIKLKLQKIFNNRSLAVDDIFNETANVLTDILELTSVVSNDTDDEILLKKIDLIPINKNMATVIVVDSNGNVLNKMINLNQNIVLQDLEICINIFNDRLINSPLLKIIDKIKALMPIVEDQVQNYELLMQTFVNSIFNFKSNNNVSYHGRNKILNNPEFNDHHKMLELLKFLENTSIWKQIAAQSINSDKIKIINGSNIGNEDISVISNSYNLLGKKYQLSVVGPKRMEYKKIISFLDYISEEVKKINSK